MSEFYHLAVERVRQGDGKVVTDCLCLNGSAHAMTARNKGCVTCPRCLQIMEEQNGISQHGIWTKTDKGWSTFASDLNLELGGTARTPQGELIDLSEWRRSHDRDNDLVCWRKDLLDGKELVIFND